MEKVSVIMPCYNDGKYIEEAVASIRMQTYHDIELIIINDGSDDPLTLSVLKKLGENGAMVLTSNHLGPSAARNAGIGKASGKYIMPLDADDTIEPDYIEKAVAVLDKYDSVGIVYCHADLFGKKSGSWNLPDYSLKNMLVDNVIFVTALFRREDWQKIGGFSSAMKNGLEDYDFWLSIMELGREVYQLPETLFHYRIKSASRTTKLMDDASVLKETYRTIYERHTALFSRYKDEYAIALREALIDQIQINRTYQKMFGILDRIKIISAIRKRVKRMLLKR